MPKSIKIIALKNQKHVNILGINVLSSELAELLTAVEEKITHNNKFYILTPNPELILASQKDKELKNALNNADFAVPDGIGLKLADSTLNIIKGRELFLELIKLAKKKSWKVFLLGGLSNEAELAAKKLKIKSLKLKIETAGGPEVSTKLSIKLIEKINKFAPDLLFVAFNNPKQEIFVAQNYKKLNSKGMMAVGGTFRYIAGLSKLPPKWLSHIGLEWFWRLVTEPRRIRRVFNATFIFPVRLLLWRLFQ